MRKKIISQELATLTLEWPQSRILFIGQFTRIGVSLHIFSLTPNLTRPQVSLIVGKRNFLVPQELDPSEIDDF